MDWLFERRNKSLASSAQRVVADMHKHLERAKQRNRELESMIMKFQHLCTESLESELIRLETHKKELEFDLENIEKQISEKRLMIQKTSLFYH